jgi:hypothetical protein
MYSGSDLGKVPVTGHYSNKKSVLLQNIAFLMFAAVLLPRKVLMKDIKYTILSLSTFVSPFYFGSGYNYSGSGSITLRVLIKSFGGCATLFSA